MKVCVHVGSDKCGCITCPNCGAHELLNCHLIGSIPSDNLRWQIRPFKVDNWSHCMICGCWFNSKGEIDGNRNVPLAYIAFSEARERVKESMSRASAKEKMNAFVSICRNYGLKMENWSEEFDEKQIDIMAQGYGLV